MGFVGTGLKKGEGDGVGPTGARTEGQMVEGDGVGPTGARTEGQMVDKHPSSRGPTPGADGAD